MHRQAQHPEQLHNGVVEVQVDVERLVLAGGVHRRHGLLRAHGLLLVLRDDALKGALRELGALVLVKVHVRHHDLRAQGRGRQGRQVRNRLGGPLVVLAVELGALLDRVQSVAVRRAQGTTRQLEQLDEGAEPDAHLDAVELQRHKRQRKTRVQSEPEVQGDIQDARLATQGLQRKNGVVLTRHLLQTLTRGTRQLLPDVHQLTVNLINALTTNEEVGALNGGLPHGVGPVRLNADIVHLDAGRHNRLRLRLGVDVPQTNTRQIDAHVHPVHQVADTVQVATGGRTELRGTLVKVQVVRLQSEVGVPLNYMTPVGNHGLSRENAIG